MLKKLTYLILFLLVGCIDPVRFKFDGPERHLVVEAKFTNVAEINYVKLTYSIPYGRPYSSIDTTSTVYITSEEGEHFVFYHYQAGLYYPEQEAQGIAGHTYTLHVITQDDVHYESEPVTMKPAVPIDNIHFAYDEVYNAETGEREETLTTGYQIYVDYEDPLQEQNFYRWTAKKVYEVTTFPELHLMDPCPPVPVCPPDPKPCCKQCWIRETREPFSFNNDELSNGKKVVNQKTLFIPFKKYLNVKLKLTLYQHAITEEAYHFFSALDQQRQNTGGIFDPPPSALTGNIFNVQDEDEQVIGIFDASAVSAKEITIERKNIPYTMEEFVYNDDCRLLPNATTEEPQDW